MMSVIRPALGVARSELLQPREDRRQVLLAHMRQHQILLMADADFAEAELVHQVGERIHLLGVASPGTRRWVFSEMVAMA